MTEVQPVGAAQRLVLGAFRTVRRVARQLERRLRYRRLGWV